MLSNLGQQALELQLERFFTVWAWKWDIEDEDFGIHLGMCEGSPQVCVVLNRSRNTVTSSAQGTHATIGIIRV